MKSTRQSIPHIDIIVYVLLKLFLDRLGFGNRNSQSCDAWTARGFPRIFILHETSYISRAETLSREELGFMSKYNLTLISLGIWGNYSLILHLLL